MPIFEYKGLNRAGKNIKGTIDAENMRSAKVKLKKDRIFVVDIKNKAAANPKKSASKAAKIGAQKIADVAMVTRQLATLLKANVPLVDSLAAVSEQTENEVLSEIFADIKNMLNEGSSFFKGLQKYPKVFDKIFISMCEAGETSGTLDEILIRLAEFLEARNELNSKVKSAMMYPMIMFVFIGLILVGLFLFVIPQIVEIFEASPDLTLQWYTLAVIKISDVMVNYWHVLGGVAIMSFMIFRSWKNSESGRPQYDLLTLKLPLFGPMIRMIAVSRFTRTLSTLLNGGVPMLQAMQIVRNVVSNEVLAQAIDTARDNISEGESIAGPLRKSGQFPPIVIHMINIGEKTGELENMLNQVSDAFDFQVKTKIDGLTSLLEPVMLIFMGGVIGAIVASVMVPIFDLSTLGG